MAAARSITSIVGAVSGLALAAAGAVATAPTVSATPTTTLADAAKDPGWDYQTCESHGVPARAVDVDNPGPSATWSTYWVDGTALTTLAPPPGAYTYVLPTVPPGEHLWQVTAKYEDEPTGEGELITTPECPEDPDLPDTPPASQAPNQDLTMHDIGVPECRVEDGLVAQGPVGYHHLNADPTRAGRLEVRVDGMLAESFVVPAKTGRKGRLDLAPGSRTVSLHVTGQSRTKTQQIEVGDCSTEFVTQPSSTVVRSGERLRVSGGGALKGERLRLFVSGQQVGEAVAGSGGAINVSGVLPETWKQMSNRTVSVRGGATGRIGSTHVSTVVPKALTPTVWKSTMPRGSKQRVTVSGLVPHERAVVMYGGRWISPSGSRANSLGRYSLLFDPGTYPGRKTVTVRGHDDSRRGSVTFTLR